MRSIRDRFSETSYILTEMLMSALLKLNDDGRNGRIVQILVDNLEAMGRSAIPDAELLLIRALQFRSANCRLCRQYEEARGLYIELLSLLRPYELEFQIETAGLIRTFFDLGEQQSGFELIAEAASKAIDLRLECEVVYDYIALSRFGDFSLGRTLTNLRGAVLRYVERCHPQELKAFENRWDQNADAGRPDFMDSINRS